MYYLDFKVKNRPPDRHRTTYFFERPPPGCLLLLNALFISLFVQLKRWNILSRENGKIFTSAFFWYCMMMHLVAWHSCHKICSNIQLKRPLEEKKYQVLLWQLITWYLLLLMHNRLCSTTKFSEYVDVQPSLTQINVLPILVSGASHPQYWVVF